MNDSTVEQSADDQYHVVRNGEDQYSIRHAETAVPNGWETVGEPAAKVECLSRIAELWTDMRPASLRAGTAGRTAAR